MKNKKGITLIALIITIIVLLILAGVTINMVLGENGLFNKAKTAVGKYENAQAQENALYNLAEENIAKYSHRGTNNYDKNIYGLWNTLLYLAGIENPETYNDKDIFEDDEIINKILSSEDALEYIFKSKYFIIPSICNSEKMMNAIISNKNIAKRAILDNYFKGQIIKYNAINKFDNTAVKIQTSSTNTTNMLVSSTNADNVKATAFNGVYPSGSYNYTLCWLPAASQDNDYIGYEFNKAVVLYKMVLNMATHESTGSYSYIIQGKNQDGNWENIGNEYIFNSTKSFTTKTHYINNEKAYYGYRIKNNYSATGNGKRYWHVANTSALGIGELQFYCLE